MADEELQVTAEEVRTRKSRGVAAPSCSHAHLAPVCAQGDAAFDAGLKKKKKARRVAVSWRAIAAAATACL